MVSRRDVGFALVGVAVGAGLARSRSLRHVWMGGSSIAAPAAAGWVTDFLNAAYYARPLEDRSLDDLRLAWAVLTTRWHQLGRRLGALDVIAFHRVYGRDRLAGRPRGTLTGDALLAGAERLFGGWFGDGWESAEKRGWGIVFSSAAARASFRPEARLTHGSLGRITPPERERGERRWHTYPAVPCVSAERTLDALLDPPRWPDFSSELGKFTPVRSGGLLDQTFEIDIVVGALPRFPAIARAYVTATRVLTDESSHGLAAHAEALVRAVGEASAIPRGARVRAALELTTHEGHFMGAARSNILLYEHEGRAYLRDIGEWDAMSWTLDVPYRHLGARAQHAFWGGGHPRESMLHQFAGA